MSFQLIFRPEAFIDIKDATVWYEQQKVGLGNEFYLSVQITFEKIHQNPFLFQVNEKQIRKAYLNRFPYHIYYFLTGYDIVVLGVLHTSRNHPKILKRRK